MKRARSWTLIVLSILAIVLFVVAGCNNPVAPPSDDGGDSEPGPAAPDPPAVPSGLASSEVSHDSATLSWDTVTDASGYELYRSPDDTVTTSDTLVYEDSDTSFTDSGLTGSTDYYYAVLATNSAGSSDLSSAVLVTTLSTPETPPETPTNFAVTGTTESSIVLGWDAASDVDTYYLYASDAEPVAQEAGNLVDELDGTATSAAATGLSAETTHYFALVAKNGAGESSPAETSETTTSVPDSPPDSAPENLRVVADTETTAGFELTWDAVADASWYEVYRSTNDGVADTDTLAYDGPLTSFEETELASGTTYYYAIRASNTAGDSTLSPEIDATTLPGKVSNVSVATNGTNPTTDLDVSWDAVTTAAIHNLEYEIAWDSDQTFPDELTDLASDGYTITGLASGTAYYVRVRAVFDNGLIGAWSSIRTGTTDAVLAAPANLAVGGATTSSLDVSWDAVTDADGYDLYRRATD
ncbi:MAG: fibronectin type III domain-containing protein, partial [Spirochaetota bacterium]